MIVLITFNGSSFQFVDIIWGGGLFANMVNECFSPHILVPINNMKYVLQNSSPVILFFQVFYTISSM